MKYVEFLKVADLRSPQQHPPFVIAEAGVNHEGSLDTARRLIEDAAAGGADAIKFQSYKAETLASMDSPAYWDLTQEPTTSQYALFKKHDKFWKDEFEQLRTWSDEVGIEFMSTPFDAESADFLNELMDVFKISSSDLTNRPFIEQICRYGKPVILSVGASELHEIFEAVGWIEASGNSLSILHCVLNYPTEDENANLGAILDLRQRFPDRIIGYSDHTLPKDMKTCEVAWLLGAQVIEKHFTLDKTLKGNDHYHAMDIRDLAAFKSNINYISALLGSFRKTSLPSEKVAREHARRSLVAKKTIAAGQIIDPDSLTWKRPASGVSPRYFQSVVGRIASETIEEDTVLRWEMLE